VATLGNIVVVAQRLLDRLGTDGPAILDREVAAHREEGDEEAARYWERVAKSARYIQSVAASKRAAGHGSRPFEVPAGIVRRGFRSMTPPGLLMTRSRAALSV